MKKLKIDNLSSVSLGVISNHMVRKSEKQKNEFAKYLKENLPDLNNFKIEEIEKNKNIVIGDINKSKYVFAAHYDTPATLFVLPNFLTPKNPVIFILYQLIIATLIIGFSFLIGLLATLINIEFIIGYLLGLFLFAFQMMYGYPNKNNYNDNTSGVITLIELYLSLSTDERENCTFIFFDNEEKGMKGSKAFNKKHKDIMDTKELVNFDCVADGDHILIIHKNIKEETLNKINTETNTNKNIILTQSKNTIYPSDQKKFKNSIGVASFHKNKYIGYYVARIHTIFDTNFDEDNIFILVNTFKPLVVLTEKEN